MPFQHIRNPINFAAACHFKGAALQKLVNGIARRPVIDQLLGHSRRDILRFYTVRVPEYLRDAVIKLEQFRTAKTGRPHSDSSFPDLPAQLVEYVLALATAQETGHELRPDEHSGGDNTNDRFKALGYEIKDCGCRNIRVG